MVYANLCLIHAIVDDFFQWQKQSECQNSANASFPMWRFPKIGATASCHPFIDRIFHGINHPSWVPPFMEPPHIPIINHH